MENKKEDWKNILQRTGPLRMGVIIVCGVILLLLSCKDSIWGDHSIDKEEQVTGDNGQKYREQTETELIRLLNQVQGVGKVQVMVNMKPSGDRDLEDPEIIGVAVVCDGGDNIAVKREITEAVSALFQLESHKIKVMKSKEAKE